MILWFWLATLGLVVLLLVSSTVNLCLRKRAIVAVSKRLQKAGREDELTWVTGRRESLVMATAMLRTVSLLAVVFVVMELCEVYGLASVTRDLTAFFASFVIILLFGVAIPSGVAKYAAGAVIATSLPALHALHWVSAPLLASLRGIDTLIRRLAGVPPRTALSDADDVEREILEVVNEGKLQGAFDDQEQEMIESVIQFGDNDVESIMTPRTDMIAIEQDATLTEAIDLIGREGHSRIPVYDGTVDNILGVLYAKDLLPIARSGDFDITTIMRTVPFIPDNKPIDDLLQEFRERKVHMAIVLDEYGGTSGLVTIEDILEELVGEITDEFEEGEVALTKRIDDQRVEVDARMRVDELNHELNISLPENDDYETIGGFVFSSMGRIPRIGDECRHGNVRISVIAAEPRRINRLMLHIQPPPESTNTQPA